MLCNMRCCVWYCLRGEQVIDVYEEMGEGTNTPLGGEGIIVCIPPLQGFEITTFSVPVEGGGELNARDNGQQGVQDAGERIGG